MSKQPPAPPPYGYEQAPGAPPSSHPPPAAYPPPATYPPPAAYPPAAAYPPPATYPPAAAYPPPQAQAPVMPVVVAAQPAQFGRYSIAMTCPNCRAQIQTAVDYEAGSLTWLWCFVLFLFTGVCCFLAFLIDSCKDAVHRCPSCQTIVGRAENSHYSRGYGYRH